MIDSQFLKGSLAGSTADSDEGSKDSVGLLLGTVKVFSNFTRLLSTRELVLSSGGNLLLIPSKTQGLLYLSKVPEHSVVPYLHDY